MLSIFPAKNRHERLILVGAFFIFLVLSAVLNAYHEPWRDEAQAWLISMHDSFPGDIIRLSFNELSPMLWHLVLYPFARGGAPYETEAVIHFVLIALAGFIWMRHAPFPTLHKVLFLFGYFMAYEYNVIARNYVLTVLALFLVAAYFKTHVTKPWLFYTLLIFLASASIYGTVIAFSVALWHAIQKDKHIVFPFFILSGIIFLFVILTFAPTGIEKGLLSFFPVFSKNVPMWWNTQVFLGSTVGAFLGALFILVPLLFFASSMRIFFLYALTAANLIFTLTASNAPIYRHPGILFLFFIASLWIFRTEETVHAPKQIARLTKLFPHSHVLTVLLLLQVSGTAVAAYLEIKYPFSYARDTATFILQRGLSSENTALTGFPSPTVSSLLPFLSGKFDSFFIPEYKEEGTFLKWAPFTHAGKITPEEHMKRIEGWAASKTEKNLLIASAHPLDSIIPGFSERYKRIAAFDNMPLGTDEIYYLFERK